MASTLETHLKTIVRDHPDARMHPVSPNGPYVRAVMWSASPDLLGQAFWEPENPPHQQWVVRAVYLYDPAGEPSPVVNHPATKDDIPASISAVITHLRRRHQLTG